jgi:hypothetical protein
MSDLPPHPDTGTAARPAEGLPDDAIGGWSGRRKLLVAAAVVGVLALFVVLHLTGVVGSEGH